MSTKLRIKAIFCLVFAVFLYTIPCINTKQRSVDTINICLNSEPPGLDPTVSATQVIREIAHENIYEGLVTLDRFGKVQPKLAESWIVSRDNNGRLSYTFFLRQNVLFHDGTPFTSADVAFTLQRALGDSSRNTQRWIFEPIANIITPDDHTVTIVLKESVTEFLEGLTWGDAVIVSAKSAAMNYMHPIGTGPYRFKQWQRGQAVFLEFHEQWWGHTPHIKNARFSFIEDPHAQVFAVQSGSCDIIPNFLSYDTVPHLRLQNQKLKIHIGTTEGEVIMAMNNSHELLSNSVVRRAIVMAIDRNYITEVATAGIGVLIGSHFSPRHQYYLNLTNHTPYDPKASAKLLASANIVKPLQLRMIIPNRLYAQRAGEAIAGMLSAIDINVIIEIIPFAQWIERIFINKDYDLTIVAHTEPNDINIYTKEDYYFKYQNPNLRSLLESIRIEQQVEQRKAMYYQAQTILANDNVNAFLFMLPKITVANSRLLGIRDSWFIPVNTVSEMHWD